MSFAPLISSLGLLFGALLLGVTSSLALAAVARGLGGWAKWPVAILAKTVALFPLSTLLWAALGYWVGHLGLPISSLMPAPVNAVSVDFPSQAAQVIWWWAPPVFFLSLPLTGQLLAASLVGRRPWQSQVRIAGLLGIAWLPVVEDAFHLSGALAGVIPALHAQDTSSVLAVFWPVVALAFGWWCVASAWPRTAVPYEAKPEDKICEGAIAIGLSPHQVWKDYLFRNQMVQAATVLCFTTAFGVVLWISYGCPGYDALSSVFQSALRLALTSPWIPLQTALPYALCALSLWLLGRIILPLLR